MAQLLRCLWLIMPLGLVAAAAQPKTGANGQVESPRLKRLEMELQQGKRSALDEFWAAIPGHAPLVESMAGSNEFSLVTFIWRATNQTERVVLSGGPPSRTEKLLTRMPGTDLWFRSEIVANDGRFSYGFDVLNTHQASDTEHLLPDPLNVKSFDGRSIIELPDAPPQRWIERLPDVPKGKIVSSKLFSRFLNQDREIGIYIPANYSPQGKKCNLLVVFDGTPYLELIPLPVILDNLIAQGRIPPTIAVGIPNPSDEARRRDLHCYEPFADFVARELVPWVREHYRITSGSAHVVVTGSSAGGLTAAFCAFRFPKVFGNVLSQSGAFWYAPGQSDSTPEYAAQRGWLTHQFAVSRRLPLKFYIESGRFEFSEQLADHRHLRDVLEAKGYPVIYREYDGGHDYFNWRGTIGDALISLVGESQ